MFSFRQKDILKRISLVIFYVGLAFNKSHVQTQTNYEVFYPPNNIKNTSGSPTVAVGDMFLYSFQQMLSFLLFDIGKQCPTVCWRLLTWAWGSVLTQVRDIRKYWRTYSYILLVFSMDMLTAIQLDLIFLSCGDLAILKEQFNTQF